MKISCSASVLALLLGAGGCTPQPAAPPLEERYYPFCCQRFDCPEDVAEVMQAHGFDCVGVGGSFGATDVSIRGTPADRLQARELALRFANGRGWSLGWMADHIIVQEPWDELGWETGPWMRLATVEHRITPTLQVLTGLDRDAIPTYFLFGERADLIFVKSRDLARAADLVQRDALPGVVVLPLR